MNDSPQSATGECDDRFLAGGAWHVPPPIAPPEIEAWYAPGVRAQYEVHPGVIATIREVDAGFEYEVREPGLGSAGREALSRIDDHFSGVTVRRPLTREGTVERAAAGLEGKYRQVLDRLLDVSNAARRRIHYYALCELRLLGDVTPLALDRHIDTADIAGDDDGRLIVHTERFAPATTGYRADAEYVERIAGERFAQYTVPFAGFDVPVVVYREYLLGNDQFATKYAVQEPDLLPGDDELIEECKERIWEANVERVVDDRYAFVAERARRFLSRRLTARHTRAWVEATRHRVTGALAEYDLAVPPVDDRFAPDRLDDLVYYVLRDYVGEGILTIPIRDPHLEDVEANRVGERVKVVPRPDVLDNTVDSSDVDPDVDPDVDLDAGPDANSEAGSNVTPNRRERTIDEGRIPTNLAFDDEISFTNVVTQLAAADGTELNASTPSAKVNLDLPDVDETVRCAVALSVISEGGPHVSIRKQAPDVMTPVDLIQRDALSTEIVTLLWLSFEHHRVVLFSGPTGVGKTTLMNAHMPFVPFDDRPISIDEGSREVRLPHETGVSLTTRDHESEYKRVTMANLMTETNYLNPDVEVIAEINTPASFETFAETLNTGHGVVGTTHAEDVETLVNRVIEQGLPPYLLRELDLVVFPRYVNGRRYVGEVVELLSADEYAALDADARTEDGRRERSGTIRKDGREIHWNAVASRTAEGTFDFAYAHPELGDDDHRLGLRLFHRLAQMTDREVTAVESEFRRKHRYVQYLVREGITDFEALFAFLADLRTDEAATVERVRGQNDDRGVSVDGDDTEGGVSIPEERS